jgi:glutamate carboxypeptidase
MKYFTSETVRTIHAYLEKRMPRYLEILRDMVGTNSFTQNPDGVNRVGDYTAAVFSDLGFSAERIQSAIPTYGRHLVLTRPGRREGTIGCVSHLDTVFSPEEEERNGFKWRVDGDRIYGPGTEDVKGGTVVMLMTLEALSHAAPEIFDDSAWTLLFDASEEMESDDFGALCRLRLGEQAQGCLVFEGGVVRGQNFYMVTSRKGRAEVRITATGRGAHSGVAHRKGASAIRQIADVIRKVEGFTDYSRDLTVNVGRVAGGSQINRVPHHAEAFAEVRAFSPGALEKAIDEILKLDGFSSVESADGKFSATTAVELVRRVPAWPENPGSKRLFDFWNSAGRLIGARVFLENRGGLSDGNFTWDKVPTIDGLGPSGGNPHCSEQSPDGSKEQEYALASSFVPKALLNAMAVIRMAGSL